MASAAAEERWNHTSAILAMLANVNRTKGKPIGPDAFHPLKRHGSDKMKADITVLRDVFVR
jgi:hypothetical protein